MTDPVKPLNFEQLINILSFSSTATAVHVGEDARIEFNIDFFFPSF
ncbi:hypothetical protein BCL90_3429 [Pedobacter alluvionis]|uniref:Uncharacterized protein n=1 Tax=Pedobacter alluvionis TaxID=475253 RepID=A0A497XY15_9SPHI|nr:hypothetical protein BCL90_3429 [Pedobacter alluvionis]